MLWAFPRRGRAAEDPYHVRELVDWLGANRYRGSVDRTRFSLLRRLRWPLALWGTLVAAAGGYVYWRVHRFDRLIREVATQYELDPELVRAVVWQESRFNPLAVGSRGEIGLMQVTREAAVEWAAAQGRATPELAELFVPTVNLHVGTWYLARALAHWAQHQENPLPYALAEYNAGRRNVSRWAEGTSASNFHHRIGYPSTRRYVAAVLERYRRSMPSNAQ